MDARHRGRDRRMRGFHRGAAPLPGAEGQAAIGARAAGARGAPHAARDRGVPVRSVARPAAAQRFARDRLPGIGRRGRGAARGRSRGRRARLPEAQPDASRPGLVHGAHLLARRDHAARCRDGAQPRAPRPGHTHRPDLHPDRRQAAARVARGAPAGCGVDRAPPGGGGRDGVGGDVARSPARAPSARGRPGTPGLASLARSRHRTGAGGASALARGNSRRAGGAQRLRRPGDARAGGPGERSARAGRHTGQSPGR